jgi:hypothetical protein
MFTFRKDYFFLTILLFLIEVLIALYVRDRFIRPYLGDVLVVLLMYCFLRTFLKAPVIVLALSVLAFSFLVEASQYFNLVERLGLGNSRLARVVMGNSFAWEDILAYIAGTLLILLAERLNTKRIQPA